MHFPRSFIISLFYKLLQRSVRSRNKKTTTTDETCIYNRYNPLTNVLATVLACPWLPTRQPMIKLLFFLFFLLVLQQLRKKERKKERHMVRCFSNIISMGTHAHTHTRMMLSLSLSLSIQCTHLQGEEEEESIKSAHLNGSCDASIWAFGAINSW